MRRLHTSHDFMTTHITNASYIIVVKVYLLYVSHMSLPAVFMCSLFDAYNIKCIKGREGGRERKEREREREL